MLKPSFLQRARGDLAARVPLRRWFWFLLLALSLVLLLRHGYNYQYSTVPNQFTPTASYTPAPHADDGRSYWADLPRHHPLESLTQLPKGTARHLPTIQHRFSEELKADKQIRLRRREEVKNTFSKAWGAYRDRAWMFDEVRPLTGSGLNTFGGWAATLVDALDTLWIMDMKEDFYKAASAVSRIDFSTSTDEVINIFETTIRYLGGLLGAYNLSGNRKLLDKAVEVGEMLLVPFDTPNHLPITRWQWAKAARGERQEAPDSMLVSELGSLTLEFTHLSQLTGDPRWYDAINRITNLFDVQQNKTKLPGLWPVIVNPRDGDLTSDNGFTLGGMSDSLYEYFPKEYALLGGLHPIYRKLYENSMTAAIEALFFRPMTPDEDDILISGDARANNDGSSYVTEAKGQHLGCFVGGMLELGGRLFENEEHVQIGRKITDGCVWAYKAMERGIMPEIAYFVPCDSKTSCSWDAAKWKAAVLKRRGSRDTTKRADDIIKSNHLPQGYTQIPDKRYILRPEAIESVFISYRITGDSKYMDIAWDMFCSIRNVSETQYGNAAIIDITWPRALGNAPKDDRMESFFLAETLKYFYLIFSEPELINLDDYVLNTEAHPFKRP